MNAGERRLLSQARPVVLVAGLLASAGLLPRNWKKSLAVAGATMFLVAALGE